MKNLVRLIFLGIIISLLASCTAFFDNSAFYKHRRRLRSNQNLSSELENLQNDEDTNISTDEDAVQKLFDEAEKNKDSLFGANMFENWIFYMTSLSGDNVGDYAFSSGTWQKDKNGHTEFHTEKGTTVGRGLKTLSNIKYYRYKSRSDRWKDAPYTQYEPSFSEERMKKREERFLFFRFTASSKGPQLDNSMLCVDTYTKFCWYYSEPGWLHSILGNKVPKDWVDFESPVISTQGECEHTKQYTRFYYYDPVGYVEENGRVVIYEWAKENLRRNYFNPRQNYAQNAERNPKKPGKSPYYISSGKGKADEPPPKVPVPPHESSLLVQLSYLKNDNFSVIEQGSFKEMNFAFLSATAKGFLNNRKQEETKTTLEKKVRIEEAETGDEKSSFQIPLASLTTEKNFTLKSYAKFANKLKLLDSKGIYIEIAPEESGALSFTYDEDALIFNAMTNSEFKHTRKQNEVKIECSLKNGEKIKIGESKTFELTYKIKGYFYNDPWFFIEKIEGRKIEKEMSFRVGYTISLSN